MKNSEAIKAFGTHLRTLRDARELSQQELADRSDIAKTTINKIENGKLCPSLDTLISIASGFEIHLQELMAFSMPKEKTLKGGKTK